MRMARADAVVIVTPRLQQWLSGSIENALDYLKDEYKRKPITVSSLWSGGNALSRVIATGHLCTLVVFRLPPLSSFPGYRMSLIRRAIRGIQNGISVQKSV